MKEIEIEWNGKKAIVRMKRLTFGELNQIQDLSADIKFFNGQPQVSLKQSVMREQSLLKAIVEAPFPISLEEIRKLDYAIGNLLFEEFSTLNSQEEKKNVT